MSPWRSLLAGGLAGAAVLILAGLLSSCGLIVQIEPVPSTLAGGPPPRVVPTAATIPPDTQPNGLPTQPPLLTTTVPITVPTTQPTSSMTYLSRLPLESLTTRDAALVCRLQASIVWNAAGGIEFFAGGTEIVPSLTPEQQRESIAKFRIVVRDIRALAAAMEGRSGFEAVDIGDVRSAVDDLEQRLNREPADGDARVAFRQWSQENGAVVGEAATAVIGACEGQPFISHMTGGFN